MDDKSNMNQSAYAAERQTACRRCGACCRKGGPCLHQEDREIIGKGIIPLTALFTIRKGEPAWDNVANRIFPTDEDIIKIKSRKDSSACLFFSEADCSCTVYLSRPIECRILKCWDIKEILNVYRERRLSRGDLLKNRMDLWTMASEHQKVCDYEKIGRLVRDSDKTRLAWLVRYDLSYRELIIEKGILDAAALDFLLGLPLTVTIRRYGISLQDIKSFL